MSLHPSYEPANHRDLLNLTTPTPTTGVTVVKFARIFFAKMTHNFGLIALEKNVGRH
jgi:hypothetical protein